MNPSPESSTILLQLFLKWPVHKCSLAASLLLAIIPKSLHKPMNSCSAGCLSQTRSPKRSCQSQHTLWTWKAEGIYRAFDGVGSLKGLLSARQSLYCRRWISTLVVWKCQSSHFCRSLCCNINIRFIVPSCFLWSIIIEKMGILMVSSGRIQMSRWHCLWATP